MLTTIRLIVILLFTNIFCENAYSQYLKSKREKRTQKLIVSTDLETIFSLNESLSKSLYANNVFLNFLYEKEIGNKSSFLIGMEYQNLYSETVFNGQLINIYHEKTYYLKSKCHFYLIPSKKRKITNLNGLYLGPSFKMGGGNSDKFNYFTISPGIFLGYCFIVSNKISLDVEFDMDGYIDWQSDLNRNEGYRFMGYGRTWMNLWFSMGYQF